ncbi:MAG: phosphonoacetaldehyde hydrolase [Planctomycetota bacterium]
MTDFAYHRTYRGPIKLVILDWAGTTLDYGCYAPAVVFVEVFKRKGIEISMEQARAPMGLHKRDHIRVITRMSDVADAWKRKHGRHCTEDDVVDMFENHFKPLQLACIAQYADLIPGTLDVVKHLRTRGVKIGSTTGYFGEAMDILKSEAAKRGYVPDSSVCATQVPAGRPHPWMVMQNMMNLEVSPPAAVVKVGDTLPDIEEGLNAGAWTIGLAKTGNEVGLNEEEIAKLSPQALEEKLAKARMRMRQTGAHYVVDAIADVPAIVEEIERRLHAGDRP